MKRAYLALTVALLSPLCVCSSIGATTERVTKTLAVQPGGTLVVDIDFGAIDVTPHSADQVAIDVHRKVSRSTRSQEAAFLKERPVTITLEDGTVTVRSKAKSRSVRSLWGGGWTKTEATYTIRVPSTFNARLGTAGGRIQVSDLTGEIKANTSGGALVFTRINGPLDGGTSGGSIRAEDCDGSIKLYTSGGGITVVNGSGALDGSTSGGSISVRDFAGPVKVQTSGGPIRVENAPGALEASTSGGSITASLTQAPEENIKLSTSGGSINVRVPEAAPFELDAETSGGSVRSELPVTFVGKHERNRLKGTVNGGGKVLHLRTSGGGIEVRRRPAT
jgi:hypothetical protein